MSKVTWINKPTLSDLKKDFESAKPSHQKQLERLDRYDRIFKENTNVAQNKSGQKRKKSQYKSRLAKKKLELIISNIENPVLSTGSMFSLSPKSMAETETTDKNKKILNHQWKMEIDKTELINHGARKYVKEGTCVLKLGWKAVTEQIKIVKEEMKFTSDPNIIAMMFDKVKENQETTERMKQALIENNNMLPIGIQQIETEEEVVIENRPKPEIRDNRAIIIDPSAKGIWENVKFLIDIQETSYSTLVQNDSYYNLEYVKNYIASTVDGGMNTEYNKVTMSDADEDDQFEFSDLARKKITMYEYWGYWDINNDGKLVSIVASWIGNRLVRLEENPFPHKEIPYAIAAYNPIDDEFWGEPDSVLLEDDQKATTGVMRAMQDITSESSIGQEFVDMSIFADPNQRFNYEAGKTVYTRKGADIERGIFRKSVEPVPRVLFDMKSIHDEHASLISGTSDFSGSNNERMTTGVAGQPMKLDSASNREMEILRRFLSMIKRYGELTLSMNKEFLTEDAIIGEGKNIEEIGSVDELSNKFYVDIDVSTPTINNDKASKIMFMMQTNGANMSPQLAALHYSKTASLWNLEDLAESVIEEVNTPPSEAEQMAQQIELERLQLENQETRIRLLSMIKEMEFKDAKISEIEAELLSGSGEAKTLKDKAQAELALAHAGKMDAQIALFDQEFNLVQDGTKRQQEKDDHEFQHIANLEREEIRTKREQDNIRLKEEHKANQTSREKNVDYIKEGTLNNDSYDPADDIMRNILTKNSLDTSVYKDNAGTLEPMPSSDQPLKRSKPEDGTIKQIK